MWSAPQQRLWQAPFWVAAVFLVGAFLVIGECTPATNPPEPVGAWVPIDGGDGLRLRTDGWGTKEEAIDLVRYKQVLGVPIRWNVKNGQLRLGGVGEEGEISEMWETTAYTLSPDNQTLTSKDRRSCASPLSFAKGDELKKQFMPPWTPNTGHPPSCASGVLRALCAPRMRSITISLPLPSVCAPQHQSARD